MIDIRTAFLLTLLLVSVLSEPFLQQGNTTEHLIWFDLNSSTIGSLINAFLNYPKAGFATYFQTRSHLLYNEDTVLKKHFNFYETSSQLIMTNTIVCLKNQSLSLCQNLSSHYLYFNQLFSKQNSIGSLRASQNEKKLQLYEGKEMVFYSRNKQKQLIEFLLVVTISIVLIIFQFRFNKIKYLQGKFFLQFLTVYTVFVSESCEYMKEAIQCWNNRFYQFWFFIPVSLISYKILESFVQRFMSDPIPLVIWLPSILINCCLLCFANQLPLFDFNCYAMMMGCKMQEESEIGQQFYETHSMKSERSISIAYLVLNIGLILKKQWTYCISITPFYFLIRVCTLLSFFIFYWHKSREIQRREQMIVNQQQIKIFNCKKELIKELPSLDLQSIIDLQCSICYEKILFRWAKTPCGHVFHDDCLHKWLQQSQTCPIDRKKVIADRNHVTENKYKLQTNDERHSFG